MTATELLLAVRPSDLRCSMQMKTMKMEHLWKATDRLNTSTRGKHAPLPLGTQKITKDRPGFEPGSPDNRPPTNRLSHLTTTRNQNYTECPAESTTLS